MDVNRMPGNASYLFPEQRMAQTNMGLYYLPMAHSMHYLDSVQRIYPDAYKRMMPYVDRAMNEVSDPAALTPADMSRITREIVHRSNILSDPPEGHNETTLMDLAGVMLLAGLFDDADIPFSPLLTPQFLMPRSPRRRGGMRSMFY